MPFSAGTYTLPNPALVTGEIVSASENNTTRNDIAAAFNLTMLRNGTSTATANLPMGGYKLTGLGVATTSGDALSYGAAAVVTTLTSTSLTATRVPYAGTGGLLQDASTFTFDGTTLTAGGFTTSGAVSAGTISASGNITVSGGTANGVAYLNGSKVLTTGSALTFDGTTLNFGGTAQRITGDFSNSTFSNRVGFQTSTANSLTQIYAMPNGTSTQSQFTAINGTDPNNASGIQIRATATEAALMGYNTGTAAALPMTFYTNGSEQMRLTSTGLGIGTSSPSTKLHVSGGIVRYSGTNGILDIQNGGTSGGVRISAFNAALNANGYLAFEGYDREYARFDSSGNLGLGVTPSAWSGFRAMQIGSTTSLWSGSTAGSNASSFYTNNGYFNGSSRIYLTNGYASEYIQGQGQHIWYTAPSGTAGNAITFTQAMTLDASGNLVVGDTSTAYKFEAVSSGTNIAKFRGSEYGLVRFDGGSQSCYIQNWSGASMLSTNGATSLLLATNGTERMRIDSSGNVGIGTSSPGAKLDVYSASGNNAIVSRSSTATNASVQIAGNSNTPGSTSFDLIQDNTYAYVFQRDSKPLVFGTSNTERMRIDSSGNLLVGVTAASGKLTVNGTPASQSVVYINGNADGDYLSIVKQGVTGIYHKTNGSAYNIICNSAGVSLASGGTSWGSLSDERKKDIIEPIENAAQKVASLRAVIGKYKSDTEGTRRAFLIAQDVRKVLPEAVDCSDEDSLVLQYTETIPLLVAAIKELKAELDATKAEVAALKGA